ELGLLAGSGPARRIHIRSARLRIETPEYVLPDVGCAIDEANGAAASLEKPEIAVARHVDEAADGSAAALVIDEDRRRYLVPVPGIVRVVLEMAFDFSGRDVQRDRRRGVQIVAGPLVAHPRTAV